MLTDEAVNVSIYKLFPTEKVPYRNTHGLEDQTAVDTIQKRPIDTPIVICAVDSFIHHYIFPIKKNRYTFDAFGFPKKVDFARLLLF